MGLNEALLTYAIAVLVCALVHRLYSIWRYRRDCDRRKSDPRR
jgi:hypothetical protein